MSPSQHLEKQFDAEDPELLDILDELSECFNELGDTAKSRVYRDRARRIRSRHQTASSKE